MKLLMYNPPRSSHPLHIPLPNNPHVPERISVLNLTLKGEGHGLKTAVRVLTDAFGAAGVYGEFFWSRLLEVGVYVRIVFKWVLRYCSSLT